MAANFDLSHRNRNDYFGFRFDGYIELPASGTYTFYVTSDDGSRLLINDVNIVSNDGEHMARERSGSRHFGKGRHRITVEFFEAQGAEVLEVQYSGPGISRRSIPNEVLYTNRGVNSRSASNTAKVAARESSISAGNSFEVTAFPNPVNNQLKLTVGGAANELLSLQILDVVGRVVLTKEVNVERNIEDIRLDIGQYVTETGLFHVTVQKLGFGREDNYEAIETVKQ